MNHIYNDLPRSHALLFSRVMGRSPESIFGLCLEVRLKSTSLGMPVFIGGTFVIYMTAWPTSEVTRRLPSPA